MKTQNELDNSVTSSGGGAPPWLMWSIGLFVAALIAVARHGIGSPCLKGIGNALFLTSGIFIPLFHYYRKLFVSKIAWFWAVGLIVLHVLGLIVSFQYLSQASLIVLAPICLIGIALFAMPFSRIRNEIPDRPQLPKT